MVSEAVDGCGGGKHGTLEGMRNLGFGRTMTHTPLRWVMVFSGGAAMALGAG